MEKQTLSRFAQIPRSAMTLVLAMKVHGAPSYSYRGLEQLMGLSSHSIRRQVRIARECAWLKTTYTGPYDKCVIELTWLAKRQLERHLR